MSGRMVLPPIIALIGVLAVAIYLADEGPVAASAEDLLQSAAEERERLLGTLAEGGLLTVEVESYQRGRSSDPLVPGAIRLPDRAVQSSTYEVDADGLARPGEGEIRDASGELVATFHHDGTTRVLVDVVTGEETRFELPFPSLDIDLAAWLEYALQDPSQRLTQDGMRADGAGEFLGGTSTRFERRLDLDGRRTIREEFEFRNDNPFLARYSVYEPGDDGEILVRETITRSISASSP